MTSLRRPTFLRCVLAGLGVLVGLAVGYVALGLVVRSQPRWLMHISAGRFYPLYWAYDRAAAGLIPGDQDGDGEGDSREWFRRTDPRDPQAHSTMFATRENDGFSILNVQNNVDCIALEPGQRFHWRGHFGIANVWPELAPRGFQLHIVPASDCTVGPPNGALTSGTLAVPVAADGSFAFDLQLQPAARVDAAALERTEVRNPATSDVLAVIAVRHIRPGPPLVPVTEVIPDTTDPYFPDKESSYYPLLHWRYYRLTFPKNPPGNGAFVLQVARPEEDAEWVTVGWLHEFHQRLDMAQGLLPHEASVYGGTPKFRLIPVE